jgi:hypothetical protein
MFEEICTFLGTEGADDQADSATESLDCSLGGLAQMRFHFAEALFDRIKVRRILRQILQPRADRFDRLAHASHLVSRKIVHDDGIAVIERRGQTLLDIRDEGRPVHWPVNDEGRDHPIIAQAGHEGDGLPMPVRCVANQSSAPWTSTVEPHHLGAGRGLVDKHQSRWVKQALLSNPTTSRAGDVGSSLLRGAQAFF